MRTRPADSADYVVVGAGSAGSIVASRLAASGASVIVLEAGGTDRRPDVAMAIGMASIYRRANWLYPCTPDPSKNGFTDTFAAGRIVGGSGSINAMVYVRGRAEDYDAWADSGCIGWSFNDVLPHFRAVEDWEGGADEYRGTGGPIAVSWCGHRHEINDAFISAATEAGFAFNPDHNGASQLGASRSQVNQRRGLRCSSARGYLRDTGADAPRLRARTQAVKIEFTGTRATSVLCSNGARIVAGQAVVLCAGAIGTPAILLRSGVGPSGSVVDVPAVGENFQDHLVALDTWRSKVPTSNTLGPRELLQATATLITRGDGALTAVPFEAELFTEDHQIGICPMHFTTDKSSGRTTFERIDGFTVSTVLLNPSGRGRVRLDGDRPRVEFERLAHPDDSRRLLDGWSMSRELIRSQPAMRSVADAPFINDCDGIDWLRANEVSIAHAVGTCRMGTDDGAVVDPELRVVGTESLRVVDASVMPTLPSGNTNAPTMMLAHRGAEILSRGA
ncbi:GMC family oxidoreductase [Gordonia amicalis]|uniref:GMC family oxidoreductase n=1 Tax=Gordonia amicalis TaxID=89053 RepID=UPI0022A7D4EA|nr:GMC family oxidoreductase [Gordonia amicalis]MCZ0912880.1 GMC family oxidoreductase [Gordonia amicalis]